MSIVVNTNVASINAQRQLSKVNSSLNTSLERLASGLRINKAGDDAAGLAIANGLASQVRGLTQATRNAGDALSLIGTAEGAVDTQQEILQRIRELAIQAANDVNSGDNRAAIQEEVDAQIEELTRIANNTEFNGLNLMDGSFSNKKVQVGAFSAQTIDITLGDFRANKMGQIAIDTGSSQAAMGTVAGTAISGNGADGAGDVWFKVGSETFTVGASTNDGVSAYYASTSAIAKVEAINAVSAQSGVTATVEEATLTGNGTVGAMTIVANDRLYINGVEIFDEANGSVSVGDVLWTANDANGKLRSLINAKSNETGVVASLDSSNDLVLTAEDGRNITVNTNAVETGFTSADGSASYVATHNASGQIKLQSYKAFDLHVGTTGGQDTLGFGTGDTSFALDSSYAVNLIDVTTQTGADTAITIVDAALNKLSGAQSSLGAITNRLENTITNLEVSIENMSAAESRIRDADFAAETANLTRAQIIQQSSVAVLSQANLTPQAALSLLG